MNSNNGKWSSNNQYRTQPNHLERASGWTRSKNSRRIRREAKDVRHAQTLVDLQRTHGGKSRQNSQESQSVVDWLLKTNR